MGDVLPLGTKRRRAFNAALRRLTGRAPARYPNVDADARADAHAV
jgi:hypothetical protein